MRELRIAMITDMVPGQTGGSYISAIRFAELLRGLGHHVIIVGSKDSKQAQVNSYKGIPIFQYFALPTPGSHRYYFQSFPSEGDLSKLFQDERIDIVHTMFPSYSCFAAKRVAKSLGLPIVAHIHTQPENISVFLPSYLRLKFIDNLILRYLVWFVCGANRIICPSEMGKNIYHKLDPTLPITVISNGIDLNKFQQIDPAPFIEKYNLSREHKHLLFVGRLTHEKDAQTLLRAMPDILKADPAVRLLLIGFGPMRKALESLTLTLGIQDKIKFLGIVPEEDLLGAFSACDLFVLPSRVELEGMVVIEAMASGKPILIADSLTSASKYFVKENGLLFRPGDHKELASQALKILANATLREEMGHQSLADAKKYDIHESVKKLESVYHSVVEKYEN